MSNVARSVQVQTSHPPPLYLFITYSGYLQISCLACYWWDKRGQSQAMWARMLIRGSCMLARPFQCFKSSDSDATEVQRHAWECILCLGTRVSKCMQCSCSTWVYPTTEQRVFYNHGFCYWFKLMKASFWIWLVQLSNRRTTCLVTWEAETAWKLNPLLFSPRQRHQQLVATSESRALFATFLGSVYLQSTQLSHLRWLVGKLCPL